MTDFEAYLERYCATYGVTPEEAKQCKLVRIVQQYYEDED